MIIAHVLLYRDILNVIVVLLFTAQS